MPSDKEVILGVPFFRGSVSSAVDLVPNGGLFTFPSGPGMASLNSDPEYKKALQGSDVVTPDSGYMTLVWNILHWQSAITKISGLAFLRELLSRDEIINRSKMFLVNPSSREKSTNHDFLRARGINVPDKRSYVAPMYTTGQIFDEELVRSIERTRPDLVIINLGGGIQEPLGYYIKEQLTYRPAILCTGAAIAFLTGEQVNIPPWADRLHLGWFLRTMSNPKYFGARYLSAARLGVDIMRFGSKSPCT